MAPLPVVTYAAENDSQVVQTTGSISATVRFELPQTVKEVEKRDIKLKITKENETATVSLNSGTISGGFSQADVKVAALNSNGIEITTENIVGFYQVVVSNLETGNYELELSGNGYTSFTKSIVLEDYSQHVFVGTSGGTFSLGDLNQDNVVDGSDRTEISGELGLNSNVDKYDLNGDGIVDVADLAYVNRAMNTKKSAELYDTSAIVDVTVETSNLVVEGSISDLFSSNDNSVKVSSSGNDDIIIPINFRKTAEISQILIHSPYGDGAAIGGKVELELEDGTTDFVEFNNSVPEGVHAIGRAADKNTVTINLGRKVAVKKVTIHVMKVEGQAGEKPEYTTITQIEFIRDIVPEPGSNDNQVKGLVAESGNESVSLKWNSVNNVTGYIVEYGMSQDDLSQSVVSNVNSATVTGLENFKTYFFQVTATNGEWKGTPSEIISAVPKPLSIPGAPSNIRVQPADSALRVSWGKTKDASFYQVFYRVNGDNNYIQFGGNIEETNTTITGLTNGTEYEIAVKAGNSVGVGPYSSSALGTPKIEALEMPEFPTDGRIDSSEISSIVMGDPTNYNKELCPNFKVEHLIDNDPNTYWIAQMYNRDQGITYEFKTAHDMNYLLFAPYLNSSYKNRIDGYSITAWDESGNEILKYSAKVPNITAENYIISLFPETKGIKKLRFALSEKTGGPRVSISEIAFYDSDTLSTEIANLFTDNAFTELKSGVSAEQIQSLSERLTSLSSFYLDVDCLKDEISLAQGLLNGDNTALGVVKNDFQSRSGGADSAYGQSASSLQPIGVSALANSTVAIYAELPSDSPVYVVPTQFYGESGIWSGTPVLLKTGRNYINVEKIGSLKDTRGGMLYITYSGAQQNEIKLHARVSKYVYKIPVLELSSWYDMSEAQRMDKIQTYVQELESHVASLGNVNLKTAINNATEISTPSVLLSLPADQILAGLKGSSSSVDAMTNTMYQNVMAWEEELFVANKVQGIIDSNLSFEEYRYPMATRQNIRYMRMFAGAFMYAAGNHVGIEYGSASALAQGKPASSTGNSNGLFGWGIAHEIGHNMDKLGRAEITNNIYSLAIQAYDGGSMTLDTRLTKSNIWKPIYDKVSVGRPGAASNVFVQLGMYWQLHLAYDDASEPLSFYNQFFKSWKSGKYNGYTYDERVALIASEVANKNLVPFFENWGFVLGNEANNTISSYPSEDRAIWYLNDSSRNYRLQNASGNTGTPSIDLQKNDNIVTLNISNNSDFILGYEIRRNGTPIGFTTTDTYEDNLGAANNLTYEYSIVPVDYLGYMGGEVSTEEIRIEYDKTIPSNLYNMESSNGKITITMVDGPVPVTGIKASGVNGNESYTVRVNAVSNTTSNSAQWVIAKEGTLTGVSTPEYFNKPGTDSTDTRIWTYDVTTMEIEGLPSGATVELLDYPGDRIDFYEGATVGRLKNAYVYSESGDSIEAGTLVIIGKYRGNPAYNTIEIEARYNTTAEAAEESGVTTIERPMNGYSLLLAEIPKDGFVSDTSDGLFIFVPDLDAEAELNKDFAEEYHLPMEIRALFYRTDDMEGNEQRRLTSETLWISCPDEGENCPIPEIELISDEYSLNETSIEEISALQNFNYDDNSKKEHDNDVLDNEVTKEDISLEDDATDDKNKNATMEENDTNLEDDVITDGKDSNATMEENDESTANEDNATEESKIHSKNDTNLEDELAQSNN